MIIGTLVMMALAAAPAGPATISGQVVDAEGKPAAGVEVLLSGWAGVIKQRPVLSRIKSDRDGKFEIEVPAEKDAQQTNLPVAVWAYAPEAGIAGQAFSRSALPAAGSVKLRLGRPAHTLARVVRPDGKPMAGARVAPAMVRVQGVNQARSSFPPPDALADRIAAKTDADGKGQINGYRAEDIPAARVEATGFGLQVSEFAARDGGAATITLKSTGRLIGRVRTDDPSMARGLEIVVLTRTAATASRGATGLGHTTTDAEGRFEIAALAAGKLLAVNVVPAEGTNLRPKPSAELMIEPGKTTEVTIAMEGPARERTVAGRVHDREGRPVADVLVFQSGDSPTRTEAKTGADGRFTLNGVAARPTFLFAQKPGYRFAGLAVGSGPEEITLTIHKADEPPRLLRKTLPPMMPHAEELALARRLIDPYAELALKQGGEPEKIRTLEALARIEPERVLELIQQKKVFTVPFYNAMIGLRVAVGLMDESIDEALDVLESLEDPGAKANGFLDASERLAIKDRNRALAVLDRALLNARAAKEPEGIKVIFMGQVAEKLLDLGETERGRALMREGEAQAKQLPKAGWAGYARGAFAEELAQVDLEAALALTKDLADAREVDRHHGNIAHELAGRDPAQSERVLAMVKDQFQRDHYTDRLVYRMAPLDLARSRRLAEAMSDAGEKAYALGMMALRLAESGKPSAREVLESAYETLEHSSPADQKKSRSLYDLTSIAGALLPVAERIDPALVGEYLWRSLAMRPPTPWEARPNGQFAYADVCLSMMLARYDRAIARSLVEPFTRRGESAPATFTIRGELYVAAAAIDPKWAVALVEAMPDDPDLKIQSPKNSARLAVANVLGRADDRRFRHLEQSFLHLWVPDVEDINPND